MHYIAKPGKYYFITAENPDRMMLKCLPHPTGVKFVDSWLKGSAFSKPVIQDPFIVGIQDEHKYGQLLPFFDAQPVMSYAFYEVLLEAGVKNLGAYECILRSEDGTVEHKGFKIVNIVGLIRATENSNRSNGQSWLIDARTDHIEIDADKASCLLMFRMVQSPCTILIHEKVKKHLEAKNFPSIVFHEAGDTLVL